MPWWPFGFDKQQSARLPAEMQKLTLSWLVTGTLTVLLSFFLKDILGSTETAQARELTGIVRMWKTDICNGETCSVPVALGIEWPVSISVPDVAPAGSTILMNQKFAKDPYTVHFLVVLVKDGDGAYLVTQVRIDAAPDGEFTLCSHYDDVKSLLGLPPGACSGRLKDTMIGVSLIQAPIEAPAPLPNRGPNPAPTPAPNGLTNH